MKYKNALEALRHGGIIILPTDTVYGIGCDALLPAAEARISMLKKRESEKRVAWLVSDIDMAKEYVSIPHDLERGLSELWPGGFTGIFLSKDKSVTIGVRVPNHDGIRELIREFGKPLAVSSLNKTGEPPINKSSELNTFEADFIINEGDLPERPASTIVDFVGMKYKILREGHIPKDELESVFGTIF
ncbi:MAG: L-threonylcarbamoyladenylate synthase [bacterium]|nr:L-threonylcarbamoyladenylate synthase [bacterium]